MLSKYFEWGIMICIFVSALTGAMPYHGMHPLYDRVLQQITFVLGIVYNLEMLMKIVALGQWYFDDDWNRFDFFVVIGSDLGFLVKVLSGNSHDYPLGIVIRLLRMARVLRLVKSDQTLKIFFITLKNAGGVMLNILALFGLTLITYAVLGCSLYHSVILQTHYNEVINFRSFGNAILLLTGSLTGQKWHLIMNELTF